MSALFWLLACGGSKDVAAIALPFDNSRSGSSAATVQGALDELYVRCDTKAEAAASPAADNGAIVARMQALEMRLAALEESGVSSAEKVSYDPRKTTLDGKTVQDALDGVEARVAALEQAAQNPGKPGPALFELRDKNGKLVGGATGQPAPPGAPGGASRGPPNQGGQPGGRPPGSPGK